MVPSNMSQVLFSSWNKVVISSIICIFSAFWQKKLPSFNVNGHFTVGTGPPRNAREPSYTRGMAKWGVWHPAYF